MKINNINGLSRILKVLLFAVFALLISGKVLGDPEPDFSASSRVVCSGSTVIFTDKSNDFSESAIYNWDFGTGASPATATGIGPHTVNYTGSGKSTVSLSIYDEELFYVSKSDYITITALPNTPEVSVMDNCDGTTVLSTLAQGTLLWSTTETTPSITVTAAGIYTVTTTVNGCVSLPGSGTAAPKTEPAAPFVTVIDNCDGTSTLSTLAEGTLLWNTTETSPSITVTAAGIYTVTVTVNGCISLPGSGTAAPKTEPAAPVVTVINNCDGTSTLSTLAEGTLLWSTTEISSSIVVTAAGIYSVTSTINGCTSLPGSGTAAPKTSPAVPVESVDCSLGYREAVVNILSPLEAGLMYKLDGGTYKSIPSFTSVNNGSHTITVRNISGCTTTGNFFEVSCECVNNATVTLGSTSGSTCNVTPVTVSGSFGGIASLVMITENGDGSVTPSFSFSTPFTFTYTPKRGDEGEVVKITVTTNNPLGTPCVEAKETYLLSVNANPEAPEIGTVFQPGCSVSTGSVIINNLPATGSWILKRTPGGETQTGNGTSTTVLNLLTGTYTFTVTNEAGCISGSSASVVINTQPATPTNPTVGTIIQPTCTVSTGSVVLNGLPSGSWIINPGGITGSTTSKTISGLQEGTYSFTVTNSAGCISGSSPDVIIAAQPANPAVPSVGIIIHPTCSVSTGSVVLNGLVSTGTWTLTRYPGTVKLTGTGTSTTITDLPAGAYNFTLTNTEGCLSAPSANVNINAQPPSPAIPVQTIDCTQGFGKAVVTVTAPTGAGIAYSMDGGLYQTGTSFANVSNGSHYITARNSSGCTTAGSAFVVLCGCVNPPAIILSSSGGSICGTSLVSVTGNTFGGSATTINITGNGGGTVSPNTISTSPFTFTYTPSETDKGKEVTITLTTNNPLGAPCTTASATYRLTVNANPAIPAVGTITQKSCTESSGSVILNSLPESGTWTLTRTPGSVKTTGTGTTTTITGLEAGSYSFNVSNSSGCISGASATVVFNTHPGSPGAPAVGTITPPSCYSPTGSVILNGLPATGTWTLTRYPGAFASTGTGTSTVIPGLSSGTYNYSVTNSAGCISALSQNLVIPLPPAASRVEVNNPEILCSPARYDLTLPAVTQGSSPGLTYTFWTDASATIPYSTPTSAGAGTYYIKGTTVTGCYDLRPVTVTVYELPVAETGEDILLYNQQEATLNGSLANEYESGTWSVISGTGELADSSLPNTSVSKLSQGENIFLWKVTNGVCPESFDTVRIVVYDLEIKTLITPNMDGRNDYFIVKGLNTLGKTELTVFDRRGLQVYKNRNYDNLWNGVDYNENPLHDDTYFYVIRTESGKSISGFIVIRR